MVHESSFTRERMCLIIPFTYKPFINFLRKLQISSTPRFFYRAKYFSIVNHHIYAHTHYTHKIAAVEMWNRLCKQSKIAWIWCMVSYLLLPRLWFVCFFFLFCSSMCLGRLMCNILPLPNFKPKHTHISSYGYENVCGNGCASRAQHFRKQQNSLTDKEIHSHKNNDKNKVLKWDSGNEMAKEKTNDPQLDDFMYEHITEHVRRIHTISRMHTIDIVVFLYLAFYFIIISLGVFHECFSTLCVCVVKIKNRFGWEKRGCDTGHVSVRTHFRLN